LKTFDIVVKTLFGLEDILASEIEQIGGTEIEKLSRAVKFKGNEVLLYKCNLHLRTAIKVLKPIANFMVNNEDQLYKKIQEIDWSEYLSVNKTFAIDGTTSGEIFKHSKFAALKTKDAIADQFRQNTGSRPSIDVDSPDLRINVQISGNQCNVSLDSSGLSLAKRGYKFIQVLAPLSETLAAAMIIISGWDKKTDFLDPMCGSGTIPIEAALMAKNIAPGSFRSFAFEKWNDFTPHIWQKLKKDAENQIVHFSGKIYAHDNDPKAIETTIKNALKAGVEEFMEIKRHDFLKTQTELKNGIIIMNPPYGERLNESEEIIPLYQEIGTKLKHTYEGCDAWIISGNTRALKFIGLKPSKKISLLNGPIECKYNKFELYKGTKKIDNEV